MKEHQRFQKRHFSRKDQIWLKLDRLLFILLEKGLNSKHYTNAKLGRVFLSVLVMFSQIVGHLVLIYQS